MSFPRPRPCVYCGKPYASSMDYARHLKTVISTCGTCHAVSASPCEAKVHQTAGCRSQVATDLQECDGFGDGGDVVTHGNDEPAVNSGGHVVHYPDSRRPHWPFDGIGDRTQISIPRVDVSAVGGSLPAATRELARARRLDLLLLRLFRQLPSSAHDALFDFTRAVSSSATESKDLLGLPHTAAALQRFEHTLVTSAAAEPLSGGQYGQYHTIELAAVAHHIFPANRFDVAGLRRILRENNATLQFRDGLGAVLALAAQLGERGLLFADLANAPAPFQRHALALAERTFSETWTGTIWDEAELELKRLGYNVAATKVVPLLAAFFSDKSHPHGLNTKDVVHRLVVTVLNASNAELRRDESFVEVALLPVFPTNALSAMEKVCLFQYCCRTVLDSFCVVVNKCAELQIAVRAGPGTPPINVSFVPLLALVLGDLQEMAMPSLCSVSWNSRIQCFRCAQQPPPTTAMLRERQALAAGQQHGPVRHFATFAIPNRLMELPFFNSARHFSLDVLHVAQLGIDKHMYAACKLMCPSGVWEELEFYCALFSHDFPGADVCRVHLVELTNGRHWSSLRTMMPFALMSQLSAMPSDVAREIGLKWIESARSFDASRLQQPLTPEQFVEQFKWQLDDEALFVADSDSDDRPPNAADACDDDADDDDDDILPPEVDDERLVDDLEADGAQAGKRRKHERKPFGGEQLYSLLRMYVEWLDIMMTLKRAALDVPSLQSLEARIAFLEVHLMNNVPRQVSVPWTSLAKWHMLKRHAVETIVRYGTLGTGKTSFVGEHTVQRFNEIYHATASIARLGDRVHLTELFTAIDRDHGISSTLPSTSYYGQPHSTFSMLGEHCMSHAEMVALSDAYTWFAEVSRVMRTRMTPREVEHASVTFFNTILCKGVGRRVEESAHAALSWTKQSSGESFSFVRVLHMPFVAGRRQPETIVGQLRVIGQIPWAPLHDGVAAFVLIEPFVREPSSALPGFASWCRMSGNIRWLFVSDIEHLELAPLLPKIASPMSAKRYATIGHVDMQSYWFNKYWYAARHGYGDRLFGRDGRLLETPPILVDYV